MSKRNQRRLRYLIFAPVAVLAWFAPASAESTIAWTCQSDTSWQMFQPIADYQAGKYPSWQDCEAWRNGDPGEEYVWSYGASVATTTSSTTLPETTTSSSTVPETTTSSSTTTVPETTTTEQTTTTSTTTTQAPPPPPPPPPPPETTTTTTTTTVPETTTTVEPSTTTTELTTTTTTVPETTSTTTTTTTVPETTTTTTSIPMTTTMVPQIALTGEIAAQQLLSTDISELSEEEVEELIAAVQEAPVEIRAEFEATVDLFSGTFDDYVPLGSNIDVQTRRVIVAASTMLFVVPAPRSKP